MGNTDWFKRATIYHILIDRFAGFKSDIEWDKPNFLGGNIKGIIEKIPYLHNLGINTIWISPFYKCSEYHGYHITDFYQVDPHFGSLNDIEKLIKIVHKHDMKIIADFVPNHCSDQHPFFRKAIKEKNNEFINWFYFKKWPNDYLCFLNVKQLPKINLEYPDARSYIINAAKHWLSVGFDGFRLDHVIGPTHNFWKYFKKEIKNIFPKAVLIGEAWMMGIRFNELKTINVKQKFLKWISGSSSNNLFKQYYGELDGVLDFKFQELIKAYICDNKLNENEFFEKLKNHYKKFPKDYFLPAFLDNHDMDRFFFNCGNDINKLKKTIKILMDLPQPIILYYGTESGISQPRSQWQFSQYGDLMARKPMNWGNTNNEILNYTIELISNRKKSN
jgi:glycosidase